VQADIQAEPTIHTVHKEQAAAVGLHAILTMPVRGSRGIVGTLQLLSCRPQPFAPDAVAALSAYAEQAAIAIENARLLAVEAERTRALARTNATLHYEITERQRVEAQREQLMAELEARHAEMERFTYAISHDLKSPLLTIQGFLGLLEQDVVGGDLERMQTDMRYIQVATATIQRLLDELLELSRLGHVANLLTEVPLSELARDGISRRRAEAGRRGPRIPGARARVARRAVVCPPWARSQHLRCCVMRLGTGSHSRRADPRGLQGQESEASACVLRPW
jgi:signal transduction histidine kinase